MARNTRAARQKVADARAADAVRKARERAGLAPKKPAPAPKVHRVDCIAVRTGYYGLRRIREDEEVTIALAEGEKLPTWVVPADDAKLPAYFTAEESEQDDEQQQDEQQQDEAVI